MLALLSIFQPIGVTICCAIAYGFIPKYSCDPDFTVTNADGLVLKSCNITAPGEPCCRKADNMGWRYLMFTLGSITLGIFFLRFVVFNFKESPKFLVYRGQDAKAVEVLQHVAKVNKRECGVTLADFEALTAEDDSTKSGTELFGSGDKQRTLSLVEKIKLEFVRYGMLFKGWQMARLTLLVWLIYICDFWGFSLAGECRSYTDLSVAVLILFAGYYLPSIFAAKNGELGLSIETTYRNYLAIYTPGIVAVVLGSMMYKVPVFGRQLTMLISAALMAVSIFVFSAVNSQPANIGLNMME